MNCTNCGTPLGGARFCPQCGTPAPAAAAPSAAAPPPPSAYQAPPPTTSTTSTTGPGAQSHPVVFPPAAGSDTGSGSGGALPGATTLAGAVGRFDWRSIVVGNWIGAAAVASATAFVTGAVALALAVLTKPADFGIFNTLGLATITANGAWGADISAEIGSGGYLFPADGDFNLGVFPLTITLIAATVAVLLFRRVTANYTSGLAVISDAARTALLFGICLLVPALIFRFDNDELGRGWGFLLSQAYTGVKTDIGSNSGGAFFKGFLTMFALLALASLARKGLWAGLMAGVHQWVAGPIRAAATLLLVSPIAGMAAYLVVGVFGEENDTQTLGDGAVRAVIGSAIAYASNAGLWLISIGVGAPFDTSVTATGERPDYASERLWGAITDDEPGLWIAPLVALAVIVLLALVIIRTHRSLVATRDADAAASGAVTGAVTSSWKNRVSSPPSPLAALIAWVVSLVVVIPFVVGLSSVTGSGSFESTGRPNQDFDIDLSFGPDAFQTMLFFAILAALVGFLLAMRTGILDPHKVRTNLTRAAASVQRAPGASNGGAAPTTSSPTLAPAPAPQSGTGTPMSPGTGSAVPESTSETRPIQSPPTQPGAPRFDS